MFEMKKHALLNKPTRIDELNFNDLYDDSDWQDKAERLQIRRWHKIRNEMA
jgi:hypothetical protein